MPMMLLKVLLKLWVNLQVSPLGHRPIKSRWTTISADSMLRILLTQLAKQFVVLTYLHIKSTRLLVVMSTALMSMIIEARDILRLDLSIKLRAVL